MSQESDPGNVDRAQLIARLKARLLGEERTLPTSRVGRLWRAGRSALGVATAAASGRLRGPSEGMRASDLDAIALLISRLGDLKGVAMKAGQMLGYVDTSLAPELRELLSVLHTTSSAMPFEAVRATLHEAFGGRADALIAGLDRTPIAVASIGQVHHGRLPEGGEVAVKVRHPGIEAALRADFSGARVGILAAQLFPGAAMTVRDFVQEARTAMLEECDFQLEADRQAAFARIFAGHPTLAVPPVVRDWCAPAVLTTVWTPGLSLDEFLATHPPQSVRDRVGEALFTFYVGTLYRHGLFHADPHPGNYAFPGGGRIVIYDFGCVRRFPPITVAAFAHLAEAVKADAAAEIRDALRELGGKPPGDAEDFARIRALLRSFFAPLLMSRPHVIEAGVGAVTAELLRDKRALMRLSLPGSLLFLFRLRFGLYAVLARIGAVVDWAALEAGWAREIGSDR